MIDGQAFADAAIAAGLPAAICATIPENMGARVREAFVARGIAPMQGIHETLNAIRDAAWWRGAQACILGDLPEPMVAGKPIGKTRLLSEAEGKERLAQAGFPVPSGSQVKGDMLAQVAGEMAYPVALKMMGPELAHKTDAGAVALGIASADALMRAATDMRAAVARYSERAVTDLFLVEPMARAPLAELVDPLDVEVVAHDSDDVLDRGLGFGLADLLAERPSGDAERDLGPGGALREDQGAAVGGADRRAGADRSRRREHGFLAPVQHPHGAGAGGADR